MKRNEKERLDKKKNRKDSKGDDGVMRMDVLDAESD